MPEALPLTLEWALRGGTVALLLLLASMLLRDHGRLASARLGALFAVGTAAYAICSASGIPTVAGLWTIPLLALSAGNNVVFWGFAASLFDDSFRLRWWHIGLWLLLVALGIAECVIGGGSGLGLGLTLSSLAFALLAIAQTLSSWRGDLVEGRRRLRLFIVVASSLYIALTAISQLLGTSKGAPQQAGLAGACALLAIIGTIAWSLLRVGGGQSLFLGPPVLATAASAPERLPAPAEPGSGAALERLMAVERIYRQEGLTIGALAQRLDMPEYRLRRLINQALGYRNFNSFLNHYRIGEAKAALADPAQAAVPVLTIALDTGFSSLGPFNRAFKAETGVTPSEYRRIGQPIPEWTSPVSNPARRSSTAP